MNWKNLERQVAKALGGKRVSRGGDFSRSAPDVEHPELAIECKYRSNGFSALYAALDQAIGYAKDKLPIVVVRKKSMTPLVVMHLEDFIKIYANHSNKNDRAD